MATYGHGVARAVTRCGDYLCYASGSLLSVLDAMEPAQPVVVGELPLPAQANDMSGSGRFLYITSSEGELLTIDLIDPSAPVITQERDLGTPIHQVDWDGMVIVATDAGLLLYDDGPTPDLIGYHNLDQAIGVDLVGDTAYVRDQHGFSVIDVSVPDSPSQIGSYHLEEPPQGCCCWRPIHLTQTFCFQVVIRESACSTYRGVYW
jgi:hypothetical protein